MHKFTYIFITTFAVIQFTFVVAQNSKTKQILIYNPQANADNEISAAVKKAKDEGKHVLLQIGGNWCSWCIRFNQFSTIDKQLNAFIKDNYVVVKVNHSPENKNLPLLKKLGYPQRFGFPVFVVLNDSGERIHTQDSSLLEEGETYNRKKILSFLQQWTQEALSSELNSEE